MTHRPTEALGSAPEAGNLWIGTDASMTSFHRDHYENLYCVIRGTKVSTCLPSVQTVLSFAWLTLSQ